MRQTHMFGARSASRTNGNKWNSMWANSLLKTKLSLGHRWRWVEEAQWWKQKHIFGLFWKSHRRLPQNLADHSANFSNELYHENVFLFSPQSALITINLFMRCTVNTLLNHRKTNSNIVSDRKYNFYVTAMTSSPMSNSPWSMQSFQSSIYCVREHMLRTAAKIPPICMWRVFGAVHTMACRISSD